MARCIASAMAIRALRRFASTMKNLRPRLCPPAFVLAVFMGAGAPALAQTMPLKERIEQCGACHGADGNSQLDNIPSLAGQPEFFIINQLILMREGVRPIEQMTPFVKELVDSELQALATHFNKLKPRLEGGAPDPALVQRGQAMSTRLRCGSCHNQDLSGDQQMPRLAKQRIDYMAAALKDYRDNKRKGADTAMTAVIFGLNDADIDALAHYAASR